MDGNRRFAKDLDLNNELGHEKGAQHLEEVLEWCWDLDIKIITVYALSTENFKRKKDEVKGLMDLFDKMFQKVCKHDAIHKYGVKVNAIGNINLLPKYVQKSINKACEITQKYNNYVLNIAIGYGGRAEIINAVKKIALDVKNNKIDKDKIDEKIISKYLYTSGLPDPDLIIRTSGEERLSGFLLWQSAYSELYFCDTYWPSFKKIDFLKAIKMYQKRKRRYGL